MQCEAFCGSLQDRKNLFKIDEKQGREGAHVKIQRLAVPQAGQGARHYLGAAMSCMSS